MKKRTVAVVAGVTGIAGLTLVDLLTGVDIARPIVNGVSSVPGLGWVDDTARAVSNFYGNHKEIAGALTVGGVIYGTSSAVRNRVNAVGMSAGRKVRDAYRAVRANGVVNAVVTKVTAHPIRYTAGTALTGVLLGIGALTWSGINTAVEQYNSRRGVESDNSLQRQIDGQHNNEVNAYTTPVPAPDTSGLDNKIAGLDGRVSALENPATATPQPTATATPQPTAIPTATPTVVPTAAPNLLAGIRAASNYGLSYALAQAMYRSNPSGFVEAFGIVPQAAPQVPNWFDGNPANAEATSIDGNVMTVNGSYVHFNLGSDGKGAEFTADPTMAIDLVVRYFTAHPDMVDRIVIYGK